MLVLTRRLNESIMIGEDIELTIVAVEGEKVKIGINAPKYVDIHRKEVYLAIQNENNAALNAGKDIIQNLGVLFNDKK